MSRPTRAQIDLQAIRHNYQLACKLAGGECLAVVKANAYGHGAVEVSQRLMDLAPAFGVACLEEAEELRAAGITKPILLMQGFFSAEELALVAERQYWLMISTPEQVADLLAAKLSKPIKIWLKVDSGMHRLGINPPQFAAVYEQLKYCSHVQGEMVVATHLACADELTNDFTLQQLDCFHATIDGYDVATSIANSAGLLAWPQAESYWARPGYMLYGLSPFATAHTSAAQLKTVMTLQSAVTALREVEAGEQVGYGGTWIADRRSVIATVSIGYGDGYPRHAANGTPVLINGHRARLAGRVSMDMITVDVTDMPEVAIGSPVTLWGEGLPADEVALNAGTIGYELVTRMPSRTPRVYSSQ